MSSLQSAITYINCLQDLLEDCNAGRVGEDIYRRSLLLDVSEKQKKTNTEKNRKQIPGGKKTKKKQLVMVKIGEKKAVPGKWTNNSQTFLEQTFCSTKSGRIGYDNIQLEHSVQPTSTDTSECSSTPPSSPRDMNEVSLHISLLDDYGDTEKENGQVCYVYTVKEI